MTLRLRAISLFAALVAALGAVALVHTGGTRPFAAETGDVLILRDGPLDPSQAVSREEARAVLAGVWAANLAGRYGRPEVRPVQTYHSGDAHGRPVIYASTDPSAPVPEPLLADVATGQVAALWSGPTLGALQRWAADHLLSLGWELGDPIPLPPPAATPTSAPAPQPTPKPGATTRTTAAPTTVPPTTVPTVPAGPGGSVGYKGVFLDRPAMAGPIPTLRLTDGHTALLASAGTGATTRAWAVQRGRLTALAETPLSGDHPDYGLVFADQVGRLLRPDLKPSHTALVRIEDVHPAVDVAALQREIDVLEQRHVPFSIGVVPIYVDPAAPKATRITLDQRPELVAALRQAQAHGATLILHGVTHQLGTSPNPSSGRTGDDYELVQAAYDGAHHLQLVAPADQTPDWLALRFAQADAVFAAAGLTTPTIFEAPHYAATPLAYQAVSARFTARYERSLYVTDDQRADLSDGYTLTQAFPYGVIDHYGSPVVPENLGYVARAGTDPTSTPQAIEANARALLTVDQSTASFFYHPFLDPQALGALVDRITALGFHFVGPADVVAAIPAQHTNPSANPGPSAGLVAAAETGSDPGRRP